MESGRLHFWKSLSTPHDPTVGAIRGMTELLHHHGITLHQVDEIVHGTTIVPNTIIERKGVRTGLITTRGFKDVLEIGRQKRYDLYDLFVDKSQPLIPRYLIEEVTERISADGKIVQALEPEDVRPALRRLRELGVQSVAVCLLHAYANPTHERLIESIIREDAPGLPVSLSSDVSPKYREYERTNTVAANAYVVPIVAAYLRKLGAELREKGYDKQVYIMQSNGGVATPDLMERYPVRFVESGPAAGVLAAGLLGDARGEKNLISFDMGGTTAKMCLIEGGRPAITNEFEVDRFRFKRGSGLPLNISAIDLIEIGAGGGSIARTSMGTIAVGPESAGADPGPVCYGRGGQEPTVTDANLVLGYLNPVFFLGGKMSLDYEAAKNAVERRTGAPLGIDATRAAWGIYEMANVNMERATRAVSIERGRDPRQYSMVTFGGAGPLHGARLARRLGIPRVLVPVGAGVESAVGLLAAPIKFDFARTHICRLDRGFSEVFRCVYADLTAQARLMYEKTGIQDGLAMQKTADMRYVGQGHEITVTLPEEAPDAEGLSALRKHFDRVYAETYGFSSEAEVEVVSWYLTVSAGRAQSQGAASVSGRSLEEARKPRRPAYFPEAGGMVLCDIYDRYKLPVGQAFAGPAIVEEHESTTVILPGDNAEIDATGNLVITVGS